LEKNIKNKEKINKEKDDRKMMLILFWPMWLPAIIGFFWIVNKIIFHCDICWI